MAEVSEIVRKRSRAEGALHSQFVKANLATAVFRPEDHPGSGDYNVHHVDLDAAPLAEWEFSRRGLAIDLGDVDEHLDEIIAGTYEWPAVS